MFLTRCADYLQGEALTYFKHSVYPVIRTPAYYVIMTLQQINVWVTVSVSVERYIAICHPFRAGRLITRKNTLVLMVILTAVSLLYNLPRVFAYKIVACETASGKNVSSLSYENTSGESTADYTFSPWSFTTASGIASRITGNRTAFLYILPNLSKSNFLPVTQSLSQTSTASSTSSSSSISASASLSTSGCLDVITTEFGQTDFYMFYRTIMYLIIIYVLPFLLLLVLNGFLFRELMTMQRRKVVTGSKEENEANLSLILVLIVVVFIFCQTPGLISQFDIIHFSLFIPWLGFSNFLFTTNSAVNFLIYTAFGRKFRRVLLRVFRHICTKDSGKYNGASTIRFSQVPTQTQDCRTNGIAAMEMSAFVTDNTTPFNTNKFGGRYIPDTGVTDDTSLTAYDVHLAAVTDTTNTNGSHSPSVSLTQTNSETNLAGESNEKELNNELDRSAFQSSESSLKPTDSLVGAHLEVKHERRSPVDVGVNMQEGRVINHGEGEGDQRHSEEACRNTACLKQRRKSWAKLGDLSPQETECLNQGNGVGDFYSAAATASVV